MNIFKVKTEIYYGEDSMDKLKDINNKNVMIVTDSFMEKSGVVDKIKDKLINCNIIVFSEILPDPDIEVISKGVEILIKSKAEIIIALGGGSPIDAAKAIREMTKNINKVENIKLFAIPTTSGTGSEATMFSVITDRKKGIKYPLVSEGLLPDVAILSPELVKSAPPSVTADTGMDVITHALEAYVSVNASDCSDALAEKALELAFEYLPISYKNGDNLKAREKMHNASCMAGIAFNSASLGLNHGIAHTLGGKFHIPHGRANAILLPTIIEYNSCFNDNNYMEHSDAAKKYFKIAKLLNLPSSNVRIGVKNLIHEIEKMRKMMNIPSSLKECGIDLNEVKLNMNEIAEKSLLDACTATNPKKPVKEDVIKIIGKIM
ncbi:MAG: alcohol dehydrogenase, iron-containing [Bacillota bacterium]|nr:alcohol dehydrogenase, iron-containing [Bacillota bacterium]